MVRKPSAWNSVPSNLPYFPSRLRHYLPDYSFEDMGVGRTLESVGVEDTYYTMITYQRDAGEA